MRIHLSEQDYCTHTGNCDACSSARSLTLPLTTAPLTPRYFIRAAMMPPSTAQYCPAGCSMTAMVPGSAQSTQCLPGGKPCFSSGKPSGRAGSCSLGMNLNVAAGAIIFGCPSFRPMNGEKGTG